MKTIAMVFPLYALLMAGAFTAHAGPKNPETFILATYGTVRTLDPAVCYDTSEKASGSMRAGS